ncbi:MAG: site-specific DNA-methyltransferase [Planctomycetaceae bacterium]|nr:site-specific DNA-methyltransferase [Planctomycetaceae bacterium]
MKPLTIGNCYLYHGDSFDILPELDVVADAVISDPPYGITHHDWDTSFALKHVWRYLERKTKPAANFVFFGCGDFTIDLINARWYCYRYDLIWVKNNRTDFRNANLKPLRSHESILVFGHPGYNKESTYNPQKIPGSRGGLVHPGSVLHFDHDRGNGQQGKNHHPTQKPLALMEWLVKTYTNEFDTVIDPFMGSGTTGVACALHNRRFIGIEREKQYFDKAAERICAAYQ